MLSVFGENGDGGKTPRLPRWSRQEILVLIQGKRVVESRGRGRSSTATVSEPKWTAISAYCRRQGVNRRPVQCRKRWSNLAGDYKKIKEWENGRAGRDEVESFWVMRNDLKREKKLPGLFDREVYDILDGASLIEDAAAAAERRREEEEGEEVVFDSGRSAADNGLFSDFEDDKEAEEEEEKEAAGEMEGPTTPVVVIPISEKKLESFPQECSNPGITSKDKEATATESPDKILPEREGQKRRRTSQEAEEDYTGLQSHLIEMLDRNNRVLTAQLQVHNNNSQLDREQRKDQAEGLLCVLNKLADALGRIADKL